jgi:hypothetical protein
LKESIARNFAPKEFDLIGEVRKDPNSPWMQTEKRMPNMATFLGTHDSYPLKDAQEAAFPGRTPRNGRDYLTTDPDVLRRGKIAFADNCAQCHSSKRPPNLSGSADQQKEAWRQLVLSDDFLAGNYLSDDERYPVSELGTNAARALGTNAVGDHMWGQMSSLGYKLMKEEQVALHDYDKDFKPIDLYNPLTGKYDHKFAGPRSFYRTPTLVSIWATAPYLHNNSVGEYNGDPSIAGRMAAFEDTMSKLLWPERRLGLGSIKVTTEDSRFPDLFPLLKTLDPDLAAFDFDPDVPGRRPRIPSIIPSKKTNPDTYFFAAASANFIDGHSIAEAERCGTAKSNSSRAARRRRRRRCQLIPKASSRRRSCASCSASCEPRICKEAADFPRARICKRMRGRFCLVER